MTRDPIVEEVRAARQRIFADCNEDLDILLDRFQQQEQLDRERLVSNFSTKQKNDTRRPNTIHPR